MLNTWIFKKDFWWIRILHCMITNIINFRSCFSLLCLTLTSKIVCQNMYFLELLPLVLNYLKVVMGKLGGPFIEMVPKKWTIDFHSQPTLCFIISNSFVPNFSGCYKEEAGTFRGLEEIVRKRSTTLPVSTERFFFILLFFVSF